MHDIEDLATRCQQLKVCGYFSARNVALSKADVIVTSYQSILSEATRQALGIDSLNGKIIVFDEAHNLMEAIGQMNSLEVSLSTLTMAHGSLTEYLDKYERRMGPSNVKRLKDLKVVLQAFISFLKKRLASKQESDAAESAPSLDVIDVLSETDLYSFDFR